MKSLFISNIFFKLFCSLAQKIPGWVIEESLKVLVRKQQEVSLELIEGIMLYGFCLGILGIDPPSVCLHV